MHAVGRIRLGARKLVPFYLLYRRHPTFSTRVVVLGKTEGERGAEAGVSAVWLSSLIYSGI